MLLLLAILNALDCLCTYFGLSLHHIQEGNPLMAALWNQHPFLFLLIKMLLSICLLYLYAQRTRIPILSNFSIRFLMYGAFVLYISILFMHSLWIFAA
ncbi:hypothetical protein JOC77_000194 [Peribacillus deserti]|uniref:DUF5658 domain-containing protein n=1 Tax=Peribacillus deserti TaxID=673318 RepID=A0ABS2QEQ6_9BACI|nr:DUF5658 family protein [Peribacillus deserti]MBM7690791.1 hypothetical protein [Peribacillus deserti]